MARRSVQSAELYLGCSRVSFCQLALPLNYFCVGHFLVGYYEDSKENVDKRHEDVVGVEDEGGGNLTQSLLVLAC